MFKNSSGVSYIELMLAILIATLLIMGYINVMTGGTKTMVNSNNKTNAMSWANDTVESIRSKSFTAVSTGTWLSADFTSILGENYTKKLGTLNVYFTRQVIISSLYSSLKIVEVKVSWNEAQETKNLVVRTMYANKE